MKKASLFLLGGAFVLLACLAIGQGLEGEPAPDRGITILYLRTPEGRLARLDGLLHLTQPQKASILRVFKGVDRSVRAELAKGDEQARASLDEERRKQFDELRSDTEVPPAPLAAPHAFQKMPSFAEQEAAQNKGRKGGGRRKKSTSGPGGAGSGLTPGQ
jgi:hypothetical protein